MGANLLGEAAQSSLRHSRNINSAEILFLQTVGQFQQAIRTRNSPEHDPTGIRLHRATDLTAQIVFPVVMKTLETIMQEDDHNPLGGYLSGRSIISWTWVDFGLVFQQISPARLDLTM